MILVRPQLGENIGMVARGMLNCGFSNLFLVAPRDGWPNPNAFPAAAGADIVLKNVKVFKTVEEAISQFQVVVACTARKRDMEKPNLSLPTWAKKYKKNEAIAILFGSESSGLSNTELNLADILISIPTNPNFPSLNLAQSVYAVCAQLMEKPPSSSTRTLVAPKKGLSFFLQTLENALEEKNFFYPADKKKIMLQNINNIFVKAQLTPQEIQTLHGILKALGN
jgi:tRNA/rRNA methyltransferase